MHFTQNIRKVMPYPKVGDKPGRYVDIVLRIPGTHPHPVAGVRRIRSSLECGLGSLNECGESRKRHLTGFAVRSAAIVLHALEPYAKAEVVPSPNQLNVVIVCEQVTHAIFIVACAASFGNSRRTTRRRQSTADA